MKTQIYMAVMIFLSVILFQSCSNKNSVTPPPVIMNSAVFPNSAGDTWTYEVYDSTTSTTDTMIVSVAGSKNLPDGKNLKIWLFRSTSGNRASYLSYFGDSLFVYSGPDTVYLYSDGTGTSVHTSYVFPMSVGSEWENHLAGIVDSSFVTEQNTITTPAGTFTNSFHIERLHAGLNDYIHSSVWFKNDIGLVEFDVDETGFVLDRFSCRLISYHIN